MHAVTGDDPHPDAVGRINDTLGGLPLGLAAVAEHIRQHPHWHPDDYSAEAVIDIAMEGGSVPVSLAPTVSCRLTCAGCSACWPCIPGPDSVPHPSPRSPICA